MPGPGAGHSRVSTNADSNSVSFRAMRPTRADILGAFDAAIAAVEPRAAVARAMSLEDSVFTAGPASFTDVSASDFVVMALGKAAPAMAMGAHDVVGASRGIVVSPVVAAAPLPVCVGSHPIPDTSSLSCGESLLKLATNTKPSDVVVFLISGGGSAVATLPIDGVTIDEISAMNSLLIASGLPIDKINDVRASVSRIKGGRLAEATTAERQVTLVLSDVVGAGPEHVASGPTLGFDLGRDAGKVLEAAGMRTTMPSAVVAAAGRYIPPLKPPSVLSTIVGSPSMAAAAAAAELRSRGFIAEIVTTELSGEARYEAVALVDRTVQGTVSVAAGETTVKVRGRGVGGRNQEAAVAAARYVDGQDVLFAALGTDGIDGPTPAAGAIVDGETASRATSSGNDLKAALATNDSHGILTALGETVVTGPTGTNVADLWIVAKGPF
jgi:glycerate 2-kinase